MTGSTVRSVEELNREHGKELGTMREWVQWCRENLKYLKKIKVLGELLDFTGFVRGDMLMSHG